MLDLRRDLYARLSLSAQKYKELNRRFKADAVNASALPSEKTSGLAVIEDKINFMPSGYPIKTIGSINIKRRIPKKIDEQVVDIIEDSRILEIRKEMEDAEELLALAKFRDRKNPKIKILELSMNRLKELLEQKSYV